MTNEQKQTRALWWVIGVLVTVLVSIGGYSFTYTQNRIDKEDALFATHVDKDEQQNLAIKTNEIHVQNLEEKYKEINAKLDKILERVDGNGNH